MTDYGHDLLFGGFLTPVAADPSSVVRLARRCEELGLDLVGIQDHPYQSAFLDTWTLLSWIAAATTRVTVFPDVASLPMRSPVILGRSAASLDLLSGGRVELGLGAGVYSPAVVANGGPARTPGESVQALSEAIEIIRALWAAGPAVKVKGRHYEVVGAKSGPRPAHDIGLWIGALGPRMLALTGRLGDGWLPSSSYLGPGKLPSLNSIIDEAAEQAGRGASAVRRLYNVTGSFGAGRGFLQGSARQWAEQLAELTLTQGMSAYILASDDADDLARFAAEVAPAVRELVAAGRAGHAPMAAGPDVGEDAGAGRPQLLPTPDDGTRLSPERVWVEGTRPTAAPRASGPQIPAGRNPAGAGPAGEPNGAAELLAVHDHLRGELAQLRDLLQQVESGAGEIAAVRTHIATMTLRQNAWTLGVYCQAYCRLTTSHHSIEDASVFPVLRAADHRLGPVLDRLQEEHHLIHDVIERVDQALVAMAAGPAGLKDVQSALDLLTDTLLSHLAYEERELIGPLSGVGLR